MLEEAVLNNYFGLVGADIATYSPLLTVMTTHDVDQNGSRYLPQMHEPSDWVVCLGAKNIQLPVPPGPTLCGIGNCTATPIEEFRRGDSNIDSSVNIADVIHILSGAFWGIPLQCEDASDSNDDEAVDISDAIHLVMYLFLGGPPPPTPGPVNCGPDPTGNGALDCQNYSGC